MRVRCVYACGGVPPADARGVGIPLFTLLSEAEPALRYSLETLKENKATWEAQLANEEPTPPSPEPAAGA
eukprot:gene7693-22033_t